MTQNRTAQKHPLVIGEVLFDEFPDGQRVLGGAPFNVAWNLQGLGEPPLFVSAIGDDALGVEVAEKMKRWGMRDDGLQVQTGTLTGRVQVLGEGDGPAYVIEPDQAFDQIDIQDATPEFAANGSLIYHGSLAWRSEKNRDTIKQYRAASNRPVFVDLNIREPWFEPAWLDEILPGVEWLKLNKDELAAITVKEVGNENEIRAALDTLRSRYGCRNFFVTDGEIGAYGWDADDQFCFVPTTPIENLIDTVGAGDAFSAAAIYKLLRNASQREVLQFAVSFAARICGKQGATTEDADVYQS